MLYKKLLGIGIALSIIVLAGTGGFMLIERWSPLEALYMTIITISSVGFMEVHPLSGHGRIFTMFLILSGSGVLIYAVSIVTAFIVEGELTDVLRRRKMNNRIDRLKKHYIVCGAGQTGGYVIDELLKTKKDFVVIERDAGKVRQLIARNVLCIEGNASQQAVLGRAGIERASGFATSLPTDAENILVVITAKKLNPSLRVISKAVEEESDQKIRMVGADGVVMPNSIGGLRMASEMIRPSVVNFLDIMLRSRDATVRLEEIKVAKGSPFEGRTIEETGVLDVEDVTIVALTDEAGVSYVFNPRRSTLLGDKSVLIAMGNIDMIKRINEMAGAADTEQ